MAAAGMAAAGMAAAGMAAAGAVVAGDTTVADLLPAPFSAACWRRLITIRSHIIIQLPVITKVTRRMARLTTACGGSGHTIPVAAPISATTVTDILVRDIEIIRKSISVFNSRLSGEPLSRGITVKLPF